MSDDIIKRLREAIAAGPTAGPWHHKEWGSQIVDDGVGSSQVLIARVAVNTYRDQGRHNATYIAAASPDNIAALLDRLDAAEAENERLREDAERLDWIASIARINSRHGTGYVMAIEVPISGPHHFLAYSNDDVRAAIDAAMAKDQK